MSSLYADIRLLGNPKFRLIIFYQNKIYFSLGFDKVFI